MGRIRGQIADTFAGTGNHKGLGEAVLAVTFSTDGKYALSGGTESPARLGIFQLARS